MRYRLADQSEVDKAAEYLAKLAGWEAEVEIKRLYPERSLAQNNYLHLLLSAFGMHFGYEMEEAKYLYKQLNGNLYMYKKNNRTFYRSSADLSTDEMSQSIDKFRIWSARGGYDLPLAIDQDWLRQIHNEAERTKYR